MVKPIFITILNKRIDEQTYNDIAKDLEDKFKDYHILLTYDKAQKETFSFKVFYEKDFNKVKFEELKRIVKKQFKKQTTNY